jgi:hypothetical protein
MGTLDTCDDFEEIISLEFCSKEKCPQFMPTIVLDIDITEKGNNFCF